LSTHASFERTIFDTVKKNLHQLVLEITKLEAILENSKSEDIEPHLFEVARKQSIDSCRRLMGNLEILPDPTIFQNLK
jgi:hypothetical protein